jgi:hypothetical protein
MTITREVEIRCEDRQLIIDRDGEVYCLYWKGENKCRHLELQRIVKPDLDKLVVWIKSGQMSPTDPTEIELLKKELEQAKDAKARADIRATIARNHLTEAHDLLSDYGVPKTEVGSDGEEGLSLAQRIEVLVDELSEAHQQLDKFRDSLKEITMSPTWDEIEKGLSTYAK